MNRRGLLKLAGASTAVGLVQGVFPSLASAAQSVPRRLVKPPRLKHRDVVGLIAPSGVVDDAQIERGVRNLESLGFTVKPGRNLRASHGGYAGTVAQRVEDIHEMFRDREVRALWSARGGSGCAALLPLLDYGLVRRNPKALVGYSDITALHLAMLARAGLVTFHGPVSSSTFSTFSADRLREVLMEPVARRVLRDAAENLEKAVDQSAFAPRTFRAGIAEGWLAGGNLSTLSAMVGTPYVPPMKGSLLFLEEVGEAPYRIDRMLTQLAQSGVLRQAAAIMLGVFQRCEPTDGEPSLSLDQVLDENFAGLGIPAASGFSFGHIAHQLTLPVGIRARLDTEERTLTLLETAVAL
jgi:muramoyltetrapeptide carboxypeptidase